MADIKLGSGTPSAFYLGGSTVAKIYLGTTEVWPVGVTEYALDAVSYSLSIGSLLAYNPDITMDGVSFSLSIGALTATEDANILDAVSYSISIGDLTAYNPDIVLDGVTYSLALGNLTAESSAINDPYWQSVVFQSAFDGANGSTSATDDSLSSHSITFVGNAQINGNELLLDGTGDWVSCADSADFNVQSAQNGQWTIELDVTADANPPSTVGYIAGQYDTTGNQRSWAITQQVSGDLELFISQNGSSFTAIALCGSSEYSAATKFNLIVAFDGANYYAAIDGVITATAFGSGTYESLFNSTSEFRIGARGDGTFGFAGRVDNVRLTKGACRIKGTVSTSVSTDAFGNDLTFGESGRSSVTYQASSTTTSATIPSTAEIGDVAIAAIFHRNATLTPPSGWTLVGSTSGTNGSFTNYTSVYRRTVQSGDPGASTTWTQGAAGRCASQIVTFRKSGGLSLITSGTAAQNSDTTNSNQHEMASVTATADDQIGVVVASSVLAATSGTTTLWPVNTPNKPWIMTSPFDVADNRLGVAWRIMADTETTEGYFTTNEYSGTTSNGVAAVSLILG